MGDFTFLIAILGLAFLVTTGVTTGGLILLVTTGDLFWVKTGIFALKGSHGKEIEFNFSLFWGVRQLCSP